MYPPPQPFAEAERKAGLNGGEHNTVLCKLPTAQIRLFPATRVARVWAAKVRVVVTLRSQGLGVSSLNRPAPPWASGFSRSGRIALSPPTSAHGGLPISSPAEARASPAACGATLNSRRR